MGQRGRRHEGQAPRRDDTAGEEDDKREAQNTCDAIKNKYKYCSKVCYTKKKKKIN